jgi:hypothetical protein
VPDLQVNKGSVGPIAFEQLAVAYIAVRGADRPRPCSGQSLASSVLQQHIAAAGGSSAAAADGSGASVRSRSSRMAAASRSRSSRRAAGV